VAVIDESRDDGHINGPLHMPAQKQSYHKNGFAMLYRHVLSLDIKFDNITEKTENNKSFFMGYDRTDHHQATDSIIPGKSEGSY
jgi:hypothetical protein